MSDGHDKSAALRRAFDEAFARPPLDRADDRERLLKVQIGSDGYAFRLAEVAGFVAARKIVPLASTVPGALGLAGIRGSLVPVYSLATLLGHPAEDDPARWFVLCAAPEPLALAFARFDGYLEAPRAELHPLSGEAERRQVPGVVRAEARNWGVISIPALTETIATSVVGNTSKER